MELLRVLINEFTTGHILQSAEASARVSAFYAGYVLVSIAH